ncbi:MAG: cob(I)yrinic acid a,c-diamide adenosyltransferase [Bacillota bacterium]
MSERRRVYTRTGDSGETGLLGPGRVRKDHPRIEACGAVDELNAWLGLARARCQGVPALAALSALLEALQRRLFELGAELAVEPGQAHPAPVPRIEASTIAWLEHEIDRLDGELPPLVHFVLPAGTEAAATLHAARTVARRAERRVVALAAAEPVRPEAIAFLNRLSDLLFVMARAANRREGTEDVPWKPGPTA